MRWLALALWAFWASAEALVGTFPVCHKGAQYVRLEIREGGFAPVQCAAHNSMQGDHRLSIALLFGVFAATCAGEDGQNGALMFVGDLSTMTDGVLGHELRHAFPPQHSHPFFFSFWTSECEQ